jgi:putative serine protease PepD
MPSTRILQAAAALTGAAAVGAGAGIGAYAGITSGGKTKTTVVRVAAAQPAAQSSGALSVHDVYQRAYRGVVEITVASTTSASPFPGGRSQSEAQGSGFVYDSQGHVVTNQHVVAGATSISVKFWNGAAYPAHVVGSDPSTDLAVIKVNAPSSMLHPLSIGDSGVLAVGDGVVAIGSPFGLAETVTSGIVSALHRQMTSPNGFTINDSIQTDAAINHGNSGGPLLNLSGLVVGVNAQIESDSGDNAGVGFAVPSATLRSVVPQLITSGNVRHAYLGVLIEPASGGVRIARVRAGTPARQAGLQGGDVITAVGGQKVTSVAQLQTLIDSKKPGETVSVTYTRNGSSHTVRVKLGTRPS